MTTSNRPRLPNPRPAAKHPPLMEHSFAAQGWLYRAAQAVGSPRFVETIERARFYLDKASKHCRTPGEQAVLQGLYDAVDRLITANAEGRALLTQSCSEMNAAEATEFELRCRWVPLLRQNRPPS